MLGLTLIRLFEEDKLHDYYTENATKAIKIAFVAFFLGLVELGQSSFIIYSL